MVISKHSGIYSFRTEQFLPISAYEAWHFFSTPSNLQKLTPKELDFRITSPRLEKIHPGQIVTYSIKIFPLFRSQWVTEITVVEDKKFFIDEQRYGPYKMWHHKHSFTEVDGGVLMSDEVYLKLPFPLLAPLAYRLYIKKKLNAIFEFRHKHLEKMIEQGDLK